MAKVDTQAVALMMEKAKAVSITMVEVKDVQAALAYAVSVCEAKEPCKYLLENNSSAAADASRVIAAPDLAKEDYAALEKVAGEKGFTVIKTGMRDRLAGIDVGITHAAFAIADTATSAVVSDSEEVRLASMIAEIHCIILPKSKVLPDSDAAAPHLDALFKQDKASYTAFISGPSRTADIERVLALGVHGPLELHIALVEG